MPVEAVSCLGRRAKIREAAPASARRAPRAAHRRASIRRGTGLAAVFSLIAGSGAAWAQCTELKCDSRAAEWSQKILSCTAPGKLYGADPRGWRDGATLELRGFTYVGPSQKPRPTPLAAYASTVEHYLFREDGQ